MKPLVIAFSGRIGSGKTTVSTEVARRLGWARTGFGDYVRSLAQSRGLGDSRETLQALGAWILNEGVEPFCRAVLAQVGWTPGTPVVIDGVRHAQVLETLRALVAPMRLALVYVAVDDAERATRLAERTGEELAHTDRHSTEVETSTSLPQLADLLLDGTKSVESLVQEVLQHAEQTARGSGCAGH